MSSSKLAESDVEQAALDQLESQGWSTAHGPDIAPKTPDAERDKFTEPVLAARLRSALSRLNPNLPSEALEDAFNRLTQPEGADLQARNRSFHRMLTDGVNVEYWTPDGTIRGDQAFPIDFDNPDNNDWLAVNQFDFRDGQNRRRPDTVLFVNGLPLGLIEFKSPTDPNATVWSAWTQIQTYKAELPTLLALNEILIVSDGLNARIGTLTTGKEWFKPWRTMDGETEASGTQLEQSVLLNGTCQRARFLRLIRDFIVIESDGSGRLEKKMAGYHQFHAVEAAVAQTLRATEMVREADLAADDRGRYVAGSGLGASPGDRRIGVVWHTQGSGKSLTMVFYAGLIAREPAMNNPTVVVLVDRNDLDNQLFGTFSRCRDQLGQDPVQAESRADLRSKLKRVSGGVVFTTIQKFFPDSKTERLPALSERRNIVVIADEAHRSQYDFIDGYASHMRDALPNASFVGFTGTPIELQDANTRAVFGDYISVYDIQRSVQDGATVPIYYESRVAELTLDEQQRPQIDPDFEQATEGDEIEQKEKLKTRWSQIEALVGAKTRIEQVARDILEHLDQRQDALDGKAMIVCMSRRICVDLYDELVRLRPDLEDPDDSKGALKVVMTGAASDPPGWQQHIRNKQRREVLANRFRDPDDPFEIVLVRDMWLTGFDAPSLHTMYLDKPIRNHGLMQTIARVNRVFRDKPGGLIVDYLGIGPDLSQAVRTYTASGGQGDVRVDQEKAAELLQTKYEICLNLFHGYDWSWWTDSKVSERLEHLPAAQNHILELDDGKKRLTQAVRELGQAFALAVPHPLTKQIRDDVAFFQDVSAALNKRTPGDELDDQNRDQAIRQIVSKAMASEGVTDIFAEAGLPKPDISILSDQFLADVKQMEHRSLAVELLEKLLKGELRTRQKKNVVQARSFAELLERSLIRYRNRTIQASQVIEELIELARQIREASARGEALGLSEDEMAFYDALETNDSAVQVLGDDTLREIAQTLVQTVRSNVTLDWTLRENVRAKLRAMVKRVLNRYGYPPDKQEQAVKTVIEQAEVLSAEWVKSE